MANPQALRTCATMVEREGYPIAASQMRSAADDIERLTDKIDGLEADLESAVETAFKRGATEWTRLNYPDLYARFIAKQ